MLLVGLASLLFTTSTSAAERPIDTGKSVVTVRVYKAGVFSALGHDHEIAAPLKSGAVDTEAHTVELRIDAAALRVRDPGASEKDRNDISHTMLGPGVLDTEHYPAIVFRSKDVEAVGAGSWRVQGNLTLHGQTHAVDVDVHEDNGHYRGTVRFRQSAFGITPVKIAGGTIRVKDEIRIDFDIQLVR